MNRMTAPADSSVSRRTALSRSSNSPRNFAPARREPRSSPMIRFSRRASGTSRVAMRRARPSTTAVFPTPGSPIRTGLFFVQMGEDLDYSPDLLVPADDGVQLALACERRQVAAVLFQRLVLGFLRSARHGTRGASHGVQCGLERGPVSPGLLEQLLGGGRHREQAEHQLVHGGVPVLAFRCLRLPGIDDLREAAREGYWSEGATWSAVGRRPRLSSTRARTWSTGTSSPLRSAAAGASPAATRAARRCSGSTAAWRSSDARRNAASRASRAASVSRSRCIVRAFEAGDLSRLLVRRSRGGTRGAAGGALPPGNPFLLASGDPGESGDSLAGAWNAERCGRHEVDRGIAPSGVSQPDRRDVRVLGTTERDGASQPRDR